MKTLFFDLETTPILGYVWRAYEDNLIEIERDTTLLCFAYKWNDGHVKIATRPALSEKAMVKLLWSLFDEADVIVGHNGDKFDIKVSNALFLRYNLPPPSPYKTVDTLKLAKKYFRFTRNKLDHLAYILLGKNKIQTDSSLWLRCIKNDAKALAEMAKYCKYDVTLLYEVYEKLKSWHIGHPNFNVYNGTTHKCPVCGGDCQRRGVMVTRVGKYQRYQCKVCGAWSKGEKITSDKVIS